MARKPKAVGDDPAAEGAEIEATDTASSPPALKMVRATEQFTYPWNGVLLTFRVMHKTLVEPELYDALVAEDKPIEAV